MFFFSVLFLDHNGPFQEHNYAEKVWKYKIVIFYCSERGTFEKKNYYQVLNFGGPSLWYYTRLEHTNSR
jgi:hypothetical protein